MTRTPEDRQAARRSDATRAAILTAARERFAADGYQKATIRAIARDAKIDPSMVMRYYGNKADLFTAAVSIDPGLLGLPVEPREELGRTMVRHFITLWEDNGELTALMRVGATDQAVADRMQSVLRDQLIPLARRVGPDPEQAPTRAALVASTVLGLAL
ncbi:MAG: TetR/AcrR family transcriptional regulator, partial [Catenulispora sp.]